MAHRGCPFFIKGMNLSVMGQQRGFSLTELVMIMVITAILAAYVVTRVSDTASTTGSTQAQQFARDLRHAQMLAMTLGKQLCVNAAGSSYSVSDTTAGSPPTCNAGAMTDPTTGAAFSVTLESASFTTVPAPVLRFDSLGRPSTGSAPTATDPTTYVLAAGGSNWTIDVRRVTGLVEVAP